MFQFIILCNIEKINDLEFDREEILIIEVLELIMDLMITIIWYSLKGKA